MNKGGAVAIGTAALAMIASVLTVEGGYVNHPKDPGGETNMGITVKVARQHGYTGPMRTLPKAVAESIYYESYLVKPGYAPLIPHDAAVVEELFDTTVNMGPARPSTWFQQELNSICGSKLKIDGRVGPATHTAFRQCQTKLGATALCLRMLDRLDTRQAAEYRRLVQNNSALGAFYKGWINHRINNVPRKRCGVNHG